MDCNDCNGTFLVLLDGAVVATGFVVVATTAAAAILAFLEKPFGPEMLFSPSVLEALAVAAVFVFV